MALSVNRKKFVFGMMILLMIAGVVELGSWAALRRLEARERVVFFMEFSSWQKAHIRKLINAEKIWNDIDPDLGWSPAQGDYGWLTVNSQGIRSRREYSLEIPEGMKRILAFGDSFTFGKGEKDGTEWPAVLEGMHPDLEVLNFGVGGYGMDQCLLRYRRDGTRFETDVVLICYLPADISRHINTFRAFRRRWASLPFSKPRFILENGKLVLRENMLKTREDYVRLLKEPRSVLRRLGKDDFFYKHFCKDEWFFRSASLRLLASGMLGIDPDFRRQCSVKGKFYNAGCEAYQLTEAVIEDFYRQVQKNGAEPVVVILPGPKDLQRFRKGRPPIYAPLLRFLKNEGMRTLDCTDAFQDASRDYLNRSGHYAVRGNRVVARHIYRYLRESGLLSEFPDRS